VKSRTFEYVRAVSLDEVFAVLDEYGDDAKILAGGQSLVPAMNMRFAAPSILVDVNGVGELSGIRLDGDKLTIGAMNRHADVLNSADVKLHAPLISAAMPDIAHATIRNRGTFGGSLCNADPASELPACAIAVNAQFTIKSSNSARRVSALDFFEGTYATCMEPNEILVSVDVPIANDATYVYFDELARRKGDYAMAGLAAQTTIEKGKFTSANLIFFAVSEMAVRAPAASEMLLGCRVGDVDVEGICAAVANEITPFEDLTTSAEAKSHMMKVLLRRALVAFGEVSA
jgi:carbon-monoxide dehydrogenase medium subunit